MTFDEALARDEQCKRLTLPQQIALMHRYGYPWPPRKGETNGALRTARPNPSMDVTTATRECEVPDAPRRLAVVAAEKVRP
jgi:hypothetical protein